MEETEVKSRIKELVDMKHVYIAYLHTRLDEEDYHGVADAAMDLREFVRELSVLERILKNGK